MTHLDSQLYERLFGAFPVAIAVVNQQLIIQYSNRNFTKLFAVEADVAGLEIGRFLPFVELKNLIGRAGRDRKPKEAELKLRLPRGGSAFFKTAIIPFGSGGKLDSLFLLKLEDVSERVRLEEQLLHAEKQSAIGHMAATIAHELGNPLSIMITSLELLRDSLQQSHDEAPLCVASGLPLEFLGCSLQQSHSELEGHLEVIQQNVVRMHELLTSLSDMSGLGRFRLEREDIRKAVIPVLSFVGKMAEKSGITIKSDLACELPPCLIDVGQLRQVFLNLLKNALEAMPKGGTITVRCGYRPGLPVRPPAKARAGAHTQTGGVSKKGGLVTVEVEDTGIGVPSRDLETIFRAFYSTKQKGMGLGLSLCRGIIEKHGGRIRVESQESKGSCFIVEIPSDQAS